MYRPNHPSSFWLTIGSLLLLSCSPTRIVAAQAVSVAERPASEIRLDLKKMEAAVSESIEKDLAVGAELLIIQGRRVRLHKSFGDSDRESQQRWENDKVCNIRSMTKPITSAAAQILIDRGELDLDAPVSKYLKGFHAGMSSESLVRHVLTHRSGFPLTLVFRPDQYSSLSEQVAAAGKRGPNFKPGSNFSYSDAGTDVVAALIESISGESVDKFVSREILKPLGMNHTFYGIKGAEPSLARAASLYTGGPQDWTRYWKPTDKPIYPFAWGSQTIYSNAKDYAKFLFMIRKQGRVGQHKLLSKVAIKRMLDPVSTMTTLGYEPSDDARPYPTGFRGMKVFYGQMMVTHRASQNDKPFAFGHSGSDGTNAWVFPEQDLIVVYFTQSRGGTTGLTIESSIDRLLVRPGMPIERAAVPGSRVEKDPAMHSEKMHSDTTSPTGIAATLPHAADIVSRFVEVTGGKQAYENTTSIVATGKLSISGIGLRGKFESIRTSSGKSYSQTSLEGTVIEQFGSDGKSQWTQAPPKAARVLRGLEKTQFIQEQDLHARLHPEAYYETLTTTGTEPIEDDDCYRVEMIRPNHDKAIEYFSIKTGLLRKTVSQAATPDGKMTVANVLADYRSVGNRRMWFRMTKSMPGNTRISLSVDSIQLNQQTPASRFVFPDTALLEAAEPN